MSKTMIDAKTRSRKRAAQLTEIVGRDSKTQKVVRSETHRLTVVAGDTLFDFLVRRMIERLPEDKREAAWRAWKNSDAMEPLR